MRYLSTIINKTRHCKKIVYARPFDGMPKEDDLRLVQEELPPLKDGEYLAEAVYMSVDPYMRAYSYRLPVGATMIGSQVAKIIETKNKNYPLGRHIVGEFGWRTHTVWDDGVGNLLKMPPLLLPETEGIPLSLYLGVLGMPGNSAYFGFVDICKPKSGETVIVTGAGGAVGSHVGQIAKIKGCTVIGFAGSDEKLQWLKDIGFDHVINYKTQKIRKALVEATPRGIDCFFDNVGGEISSIIMQRMNKYGRISVCGSISSYNDKPGDLPKATVIQPSLVMNELEMKGFLVNSWSDRWMEGINQNLEWLRAGKLKYKETVTEGFENTTQALIGVLKGENTGKAVVKV